MKRLQGYWLLTLAYSFNAVFLVIGSMAFAQTPITSSGLNTQVSGPIAVGSQTQFNITGGTRPGGGTNLFHSFGNFNVPNNNVANFLNNTGLPTTNILGRVTGGNVSNIFGTIQTSGFGNANLFLMNPAGFLFGPNATVNVGGMVTFTSADYLRLADGAKFTAKPSTTADALLSAAPVAAFGFLGSNPGAITVQGSHLTVAEGTGISLVGGNITVQGGTLTAPSGQINLVSVGKPASSQGAEVALNAAGLPSGFRSLGTITLTQGSTVDTSGVAGTGEAAGGVSIRGGQLVMDDSFIRAVPAGNAGISQINGNIEVTAKQVALSNNSTIVTSTPTGPNHFTGSPGNITFNVNTFSATDSGIGASVFDSSVPSGAVTIQGLQGSGTSAHSVSLSNAAIGTANSGLPTPFSGPTPGGPILIQADTIALNQSSLNASSQEWTGGPISLLSKGPLEIVNSNITSRSSFRDGGTVELRGGTGINLTGTTIDAHSNFGINGGGTITLVAPVLSLSGSTLRVDTGGSFPAGSITLTGTKSVSLTNGTVLNADNLFNPPPPVIPPTTNANGGTIHIEGGTHFTSDHSTISAQSKLGDGGSIQIGAKTIGLTDTQVTTSVSGGPETVGGSITLNAKNTTLTNSQILSTATEGHGGTITINSHVLHQNPSTVIDASSQTGTDGTVTINGVIQP